MRPLAGCLSLILLLMAPPLCTADGQCSSTEPAPDGRQHGGDQKAIDACAEAGDSPWPAAVHDLHLFLRSNVRLKSGGHRLTAVPIRCSIRIRAVAPLASSIPARNSGLPVI